MKLNRTLTAALVLLCLSTTNAYADPAKETPMTPRDEKALVIKAVNFRKAVAMAEAINENYRISIFAAVVEQARYDEQQRQTVARAVEETDDDGDRDRTEPQYVGGGGNCGGDLPPCYVLQRESRGNYGAVNPTGCGGRTCGGAWQFDPNTWDGYGGYARAQDAPPEVQDQKAAELWNDGAGCSHWNAC